MGESYGLSLCIAALDISPSAQTAIQPEIDPTPSGKLIGPNIIIACCLHGFDIRVQAAKINLI